MDQETSWRLKELFGIDRMDSRDASVSSEVDGEMEETEAFFGALRNLEMAMKNKVKDLEKKEKELEESKNKLRLEWDEMLQEKTRIKSIEIHQQSQVIHKYKHVFELYIYLCIKKHKRHSMCRTRNQFLFFFFFPGEIKYWRNNFCNLHRHTSKRSRFDAGSNVFRKIFTSKRRTRCILHR